MAVVKIVNNRYEVDSLYQWDIDRKTSNYGRRRYYYRRYP